MALIVETGSGQDPTANSYVDEAYANTYLTNTGRNSGAWKDAGKTTREGLLVLAARFMAARWNTKWIGYVAFEDQPLDWPRRNAVKKGGWYFDTSEIPVSVQQAQVEYAYVEANSPGSLFPNLTYDDSNRSVTMARDKVDVLETERRYSEGVGVTTWRKFPGADGLIHHLTRPTGTLLRV